MAALQHLFGQPLRTTAVGRSGIKHRFHQRVAARHHIAHDEHIGTQRQLIGAVAFHQLDAERAQLITHRRVDAAVAARHPMSGLARQGREPSHEGAADAQDVDVHGVAILSGSMPDSSAPSAGRSNVLSVSGLQGLCRGSGGCGNVFWPMRCADESGFIQGRRQVDATV